MKHCFQAVALEYIVVAEIQYQQKDQSRTISLGIPPVDSADFERGKYKTLSWNRDQSCHDSRKIKKTGY